jgi:hypothetical protein
VAVVHCTSGKGVTGLFLCCWMLIAPTLTASSFAAGDVGDSMPSAEQVIRVFNERRTTNGLGLGLASQRRYC